MARTGRPKSKLPRVHQHYYIRADLVAQVNLILEDPLKGKLKYGDRSALLETLLERWLSEQRAIAMLDKGEESPLS